MAGTGGVGSLIWEGSLFHLADEWEHGWERWRVRIGGNKKYSGSKLKIRARDDAEESMGILGVGVVWVGCGCGVGVMWVWCGCGVGLGEGRGGPRSLPLSFSHAHWNDRFTAGVYTYGLLRLFFF